MRNAEKIEFDWTRRRVLVHLPLSAVALEVDGDLWQIVESCCGADAVLRNPSGLREATSEAHLPRFVRAHVTGSASTSETPRNQARLLPSARSSVLRFCAAQDAAAWLIELADDNG
jgi:hypothetical protein